MRLRVLLCFLIAGTAGLELDAYCPLRAPGGLISIDAWANCPRACPSCPPSCPTNVPVTVKLVPISGDFFFDSPYSIQPCDTVAWDFGDGLPPIVTYGVDSVAKTFKTTGNFTISATISNSMGSIVVPFTTDVIAGDDLIRLAFSSSEYVTREDAGTATVEILRSGNMSRAATARFRNSETLVFEPNTFSKEVTFALPYPNDNVYEGTRTVSLLLDHLTGGTVLDSFSDPSTGLKTYPGSQLRVDDDDPPVIWSTENISVREGGAGARNPITVPIHLSGPLGLDYLVDIRMVDGSAKGCIDCTTESGSFEVNFDSPRLLPGQVDATIPIQIVGNNAPEPDKQFTVQITQRGQVLTPDTLTATVTILNDDYALTPAVQTLREREQSQLTFDIGQPLSTPANVTIVTTNPAVAGMPSTVVFPSGRRSIDIPIEANLVGTTNVRATVTTPQGIASADAALTVYSGAAPRIDSLVPPFGPAGTTVVIQGANLGGDCGVAFGTAGAVVSSASASSITTIAPVHDAGPVAVTIICGNRGPAHFNAFTYSTPRRRASH